MSETTLTDFLLARIAEDEEGARAAATYSAKWSTVDEFNETVLLDPGDTYGHTFDSVYGEIAPHIARHDPARVLAECEAKRRIVEVVSTWRHDVNQEDCWYTCPERDGGETCDDARRGGSCDCGLEYRQSAILKPLALPYADHPAYLEEWRPQT